MIAKKKFFGPQLWPQKLQLSWWLGKNKPFMFTALTKKTDFFRWLQKKFFGASVLATEIPSFLMIGKNQTFYVHGLTKKPDFSWWLQKKKVFWGLSFGHRNFNFLGDWEKLNLLCSRLWQRKLTFLEDCQKKKFFGPQLVCEGNRKQRQHKRPMVRSMLALLFHTCKVEISVAKTEAPKNLFFCNHQEKSKPWT